MVQGLLRVRNQAVVVKSVLVPEHIFKAVVEYFCQWLRSTCCVRSVVETATT